MNKIYVLIYSTWGDDHFTLGVYDSMVLAQKAEEDAREWYRRKFGDSFIEEELYLITNNMNETVDLEKYYFGDMSNILKDKK